jgi:hypothetical protein
MCISLGIDFRDKELIEKGPCPLLGWSFEDRPARYAGLFAKADQAFIEQEASSPDQWAFLAFAPQNEA